MMSKRVLAIILLSVLSVSLYITPVSADSTPDISAGSYIVFNADSGRVILSKNENQPLQPAEQIVIFALLAAIQNGDLSQTVTVPADLPLANNSLLLKGGDVFSLKDLVEMTALNSSVQSLHCIAVSVFGSAEKMADAMQETADTLGCKNTKINSIQFDDPKNQSTAYDLVIAANAYMQEKILSDLFKLVYKEFNAEGNESEPFLVYSTNSLVSNYRHSSYLYSRAYGIKEAYHYAGDQYHLLTLAKNGDKNLLVAVAQVPSNETEIPAYNEIRLLCEHVFEQYARTTLLKADEPISERSISNAAQGTHIILKALTAQSAILPIGFDSGELEKKVTYREPIKAPIKKGEILGNVTFYFRGNPIAESDLYSDRDVAFQPTVSIAGDVFHFISHPLTIVFVVLLILGFISFLARQLYLANQKTKKRRRSGKK